MAHKLVLPFPHTTVDLNTLSYAFVIYKNLFVIISTKHTATI